MVFIAGLAISFLIVLGQVSWKFGAEKLNLESSIGGAVSERFFELIFNAYFIAGCLSYLLATILFMYMLGRYEYTHLQTVVVASSLTLTFAAASLIFGENLGPGKIVGFFVLMAGVLLVIRS